MLELLLAVAASTSPSDEWRPLATPLLCAPAPVAARPAPLVDAAHLEVPHADGGSGAADRGGELAYATFLQMIEDDARVRGTRLEIQRQGGGALVRGDAPALEAVDGIVRSLDAAASALAIDLDVSWSRPGANGAAVTDARTVHRRVRSGDLVFVGERETRAYVAGFDVEVAAQSGQSEPVIGRAHAGRGVHLCATRVAGGDEVFVWGLLDVARVVRTEDFDPESSDLGVIQQPEVTLAQVAFAGRASANAPLVVEVAGSPGGEADARLEIRARTTRDADVDAAAGGAGYALVDLSLASSELPVLRACEPGTLLTTPAPAGASDPGVAPWPPSAVAALVEGSRGTGGKGARAPLYWNERHLFVPRADAAALAAARALARGAEALRVAGGRVEFAGEGVRASFPVAAVQPGRVAVGRESVLVTGYRLEVAPQIWMPAPTVERRFDGVCLDVFAGPRAAECALWSATSGPVSVRARPEAQIGRLQLVERRLRAASARVEAGGDVGVDLASDAPATAQLRYLTR